MAATWLMPSAMPRRLAGKASVRIAVELANSIAAPMPCTSRQPISHSAPPAPCIGSTASRIEPTVKTTKPGVVDPHPAVDVAEPAEGHHEYRGDQQEAHQHPEQVADVARRERVELDARGRWPAAR